MVVRTQESLDVDAAVAAMAVCETLDAVYSGYHKKQLHPAVSAMLRNYRMKRARTYSIPTIPAQQPPN